MGSSIPAGSKATHFLSNPCAALMPIYENKNLFWYWFAVLAIGLLANGYALAQTSSAGMATKLSPTNARGVPPKEALVEVFHTSGKNGEVMITGRAHKRAPVENFQVELAFQSEAGPIAIALPVNRLTADTARIASFGFETVVYGLPQIAPSDPRHAQPFFAIHLAERGGSRYYQEESYAQFISSAEKPIAVQRVIELPPQSLWAGVRKPANRASRSVMSASPAITLKATRSNSEVCILEWTAPPNASSSAQTLAIVLRNEQHLALTFARRYVDQVGALKPGTKYRIEQINKDGASLSSNVVELPQTNTREELSLSPMDSGALYAASAYVERTPEALATIVTKHNAAIQYCYQRELKLNPSLKGEIRVRMYINPRGSVDSVNVLSSTLKNPTVEDCVVGRIKRWNDFGPSDPIKGAVAIKQTYVFGY